MLTLNTSYFNFIIKCFKTVGLWRSQYYGWRKTIADVIFFVHFVLIVCGLVLLEFIAMFQSFGSDYIEFLKTMGTTSYHIICIVCIIRFNSAFKSIVRIIEILQRKCESKSEMEANRKSFYVLLVFMMVGCISISISYGSALFFPSKEYDSSVNISVIKWRKPYSSYNFLNETKTSGFLLDFIFQMYSIVYMSACFICK